MRRPRLADLLGLSALCGLAGQAAGEPQPTGSKNDLAQIERALSAREYEASENASGLQAPNRAHNLRTYFDATGIRVHDRTAKGSPELLSLSLSGLGRGAQLTPPTPGSLTSQGARVEIRRPGLVEWYLNSPDGLEQGFTLSQRPAGDGPLVLELAVRGAIASTQRDGLVFETRAGRRLSYSKLVVSDASPRNLPARLAASSPEHVRIVVEDAGAIYPLVIDPLLTETADTQLDSDQASAELGAYVADAGDVNGDGYGDVIVGAPSYDVTAGANAGAAFIFHGSASGIASGDAADAATKLEADQYNGGTFGVSAAGAGDVNGDGYDDVIVGDIGWFNGAQLSEGAAFVFLGSASGIANGNASTAATRLESNQANALLGRSVAGAGDVNGDGYADVIVGADGFSAGQTGEGAAFVFLGSASGVPSGGPGVADAQLESNQTSANLGFSVAGAGDVNGDGYSDVIVGANDYDSGLGEGQGSAFVFLGGPTGITSGNPATAAAELESDQDDSLFGFSVDDAGDVNGDGYADVIVGAYNWESSGEANEGAAFVFHGGASGIASGNAATAAARIEANQGAAFLGRSVAGAGDVNGDGYADVIVVAQNYDAGQNNEGAAFVFLGSASGVASGGPALAFAQLESNQASAFLRKVNGAGDVNGDGYSDVIVGSDLYNAGLGAGQGASFVYHGGAQGIVDGSPATAAAQLESNQAYDSLGWSVAGAGDVNGDGYADVIVGASRYDGGATDEGAAFVFLGSATGIADGSPATAAAQLESNQEVAYFGSSVAGAGDVNGDGYGDVIVGAPNYDAPTSDEGAAFVFLGSASGIADGSPATAAAQLEANQAGAILGDSVAGAGDVNGDGYGDVIVGASNYDAPTSNEGAAFVFLGSASGIADGNPTTAAAQLEADQADARMGIGVAGAGDVNGDGYADVIVGAHQFSAGQTSEGAAFVFPGGASGIADGNPTTAAAQLESNQGGSPGAEFGYSVSGAGDVNGDGYADVIVGARLYDSGVTDEGAAFVFLGSASGVADGNPTTAAAQLESNQTSAWFADRVAGAGDVNGDGYADVIVGAKYYSAGQGSEGAAFVFLGSAAGIADGDPTNAAAQLESDEVGAQLGFGAAGAGDVNGDGYADVIVGAPAYDASGSDEGAAFVFYGNRNQTGRPVLARQLRVGSSTLVSPWGASNVTQGFDVRVVATHPEGRGLVKLQVEACPASVSFGQGGCTTQTQAPWTAIALPGASATLTYSVGGLPSGTLYRWRARVLRAQPIAGIDVPSPAHGPWRRLQAQAVEADIRTVLDTDGDGLLDVHETDTGIYVSPTNTGSDPLDSDSDDDGLLDGPEVALGTNPNDPDHDDDGDLDGADNCPFILNANQANGDTLPAGNACQCGDVTNDGIVNSADLTRASEFVVGRTLGGSFVVTRCNVIGPNGGGTGDCEVRDLYVLERFASGQSVTVLNACQAYLTP